MNATPEVLLVIACTRSGESAENTARIRKYIKTGVSWMTLIQFAIVHGVLPLVANTLKTTSADLLPKNVLFQCDRALIRAEARNLRQWAALSSITKAFADAGVRLLAFKGAALTSFAYRDFRLRESHDVDLWAAPEDTDRAGAILGSMGYLPVFYQLGESFGDDMTLRFAQDVKRHGVFYSAERDVVIDLQNINPQFYFTPEFNVLWEEHSVATGPGHGVATLSKENYLITLAVHGEKHSWRRMNWMVDVDRILTSSSDLDWDSIFSRAVRWRCHRRLSSTLAIRSRLYDAPPINHDVAKYMTGWTTERVLSSLTRVNVSTTLPTLMDVVEGFSSHYALIDRRRDRAHYLFKRLRFRLIQFPTTVRNRLQLTTRTINIGRRRITIRYPVLLFKLGRS
jgi:hypothetical protein